MSLPFLIELGEGHTAIDTLAFGAEGHRSSYGIVANGLLWHNFGANGQ